MIVHKILDNLCEFVRETIKNEQKSKSKIRDISKNTWNEKMNPPPKGAYVFTKWILFSYDFSGISKSTWKRFLEATDLGPHLGWHIKVPPTDGIEWDLAGVKRIDRSTRVRNMNFFEVQAQPASSFTYRSEFVYPNRKMKISTAFPPDHPSSIRQSRLVTATATRPPHASTARGPVWTAWSETSLDSYD